MVASLLLKDIPVEKPWGQMHIEIAGGFPDLDWKQQQELIRIFRDMKMMNVQAYKKFKEQSMNNEAR